MMHNRSAPPGVVTPVLIYDDVGDAVDWLGDAFGFHERLRAPGPDRTIAHAQLSIADGAIMLGRSGGPFRPPSPGEVTQYVHVNVENVDRHFVHAKEAGARIVQPPADMPFGERQYIAEDPAGHWWTFSQHIADVPPAVWGAIEAQTSS